MNREIVVDEFNPYRRPAAAVPASTAPVEGARLYKVSGIGLATFIGSALAGGWLMARNYRALGEHDKARRALGYSLLATIAIMLLGVVLPDKVPAFALTLPQLIAAMQVARRYQGDRIAEYEAASQAYSNWRAFGVSLLVLVVLLLVLVSAAVMLEMAGVPL
ncbi:hypothetical protein QLQ15_05580 [Lysobacter sp. LF1]|uniref:Uncharacterized protein n=1 Tax=Lysobacter stagni TaxID=3045172 RepID=A0ABT6XE19_9GAMM|nr:hypothetical protein [Lysobacter sp. LF1]MDI9238382.1 hypothetical protein [Lysobacter sp. LF1]